MSRHAAREIALQMLFQMDIGSNSFEIAQNTLEDANLNKELAEFTESLVKGVVDKQVELDSLINNHSRNWQVDRLPGVDRAILRLAVYELNYTQAIPANVVINEAIELAKYFSGDDSPSFVNGVLDSILGKRDIDILDLTDKEISTESSKLIVTESDKEAPVEAEEVIVGLAEKEIPADAEKVIFTGQAEKIPAKPNKVIFIEEDKAISARPNKVIYIKADKHIPADTK